MKSAYTNTIDHYFDGELDKASEVKMFEVLSENEEARRYFREMSFMRNSIKTTKSEFPDELESRIFNLIGEREETQNWFGFSRVNIFQYAFAIVTIIAFMLLFYKNLDYDNQIEQQKIQIKYQEKMLRVINSGFPEIEVKPGKNREIIISTNL